MGPTELDQEVLSGRIGFRGEGGTAELWDDATSDFVEYAIPAGVTAPFAVDLAVLSAVVQVRPPAIRVNSLIGAFEKLLAETGDGKWTIHGAGRPMTLSDWKATVVKITEVRFTAKIPNPHWAGAPDLQTVMEQAEAEVINLELRNEGGLNLNADFIAQTEHHVVDRGYGEARYTGIAEDVSGLRETVYDTKLGTEETSDEVEADPSTGEVSREVLRGRLVAPIVREETDLRGRPGHDTD
ncbi:hypothetical protein [Cellulomonas sp. SG140]|uniref:hypothetical protein n=1 Tax=Cellulomonas sp. SG140 TaxID=2976536 RepID=UPI0021E8A903|nr:hypothetical protein [Cellulomonas sp. SG140]